MSEKFLDTRMNRRDVAKGLFSTVALMGALKGIDLIKKESNSREEYCEGALVPRGDTVFVGPSMRTVDTTVYAETGSFYEAERAIECARDEE